MIYMLCSSKKPQAGVDCEASWKTCADLQPRSTATSRKSSLQS